MVYVSEMSTEPDPKQSGSGVWLYFSDPEPDLNFWEKAGSGFGMNDMVYIEYM